MNGLLGTSMDDPRTMAVLQGIQGLLGARGGLQGITQGLLGYQGAMQQAKQQAAQDEERAMRRQMAELQLQQAQQQAAQQQRAEEYRLSLPSPQQAAVAQALGGGGGPTMANAAAMPRVNPMLQQLHGAMRAGVIDVPEYLKASQPQQAKIKEYQQVRMPDGSVQIVGFDEYGKPVDTGRTPFKPEEIRDFGGFVGGIDPITGKARKVGDKTQSPDALLSASTQRRGQDLSYAVGREANDVQRTLALQEKELKVGELRDKADERRRGKEGAIASIGNQISVLDKAIEHPGRKAATGLSGTLDPRNYVPGTDATNFRVVLDQINGAAFLQAFESLKGGGQITQIEGEKATQAIARLNRAQSDEEFLSSLNELRGIMATGYKRLSGADYVAPSSGRWSIRAIGGN